MSTLTKYEYKLMLEYYYDTIVDEDEIKIYERVGGKTSINFQFKTLDVLTLCKNVFNDLKKEGLELMFHTDEKFYLKNKETGEFLTEGAPYQIDAVLNYLNEQRANEINANEHLNSYKDIDEEFDLDI